MFIVPLVSLLSCSRSSSPATLVTSLFRHRLSSSTHPEHIKTITTSSSPMGIFRCNIGLIVYLLSWLSLERPVMSNFYLVRRFPIVRWSAVRSCWVLEFTEFWLICFGVIWFIRKSVCVFGCKVFFQKAFMVRDPSIYKGRCRWVLWEVAEFVSSSMEDCDGLVNWRCIWCDLSVIEVWCTNDIVFRMGSGSVNRGSGLIGLVSFVELSQMGLTVFNKWDMRCGGNGLRELKAEETE